MSDHSKPISAQQEALRRTMAELTQQYPKLSLSEILVGPLAKEIFGPLPHYSDLNNYQLTNVSTTAAGAFVVCYGDDPLTHDWVVLLVERGLPTDATREFGLPGGYVNLTGKQNTEGEQPEQGAVRELSEELRDANGRAILTLDPQRLTLIKSGIDYSKTSQGGLPVHYNGYAVRLTDEEIWLVQKHIGQLHANPDYYAASYRQTNGETKDVLIKSITDSASIQAMHFKYLHEFLTLQQVMSQLREQPQNPDSRPYLRQSLLTRGWC